LLPNSVEKGQFQLDTSSVQQDQTIIGAGAADAIDATYADSAGDKIGVALSAWNDPKPFFNKVVGFVEGNGCTRAGSAPLKDNSGNVIGKVAIEDCANNKKLAPASSLFELGHIFGEVDNATPNDVVNFTASFLSGGS
jgi:hypothetical protein